MQTTHPKRWILFGGITLLLVGVVIGAAIQSVPTRAATPDEVSAPRVSGLAATGDLESQFISIYDSVSPSVVNITNRGEAYTFFGQVVPQDGSGSGFVYDNDGHIVTNYHVVEGARALTVTLANGKTFDASVVGSDPVNDLAVIKIDAGADLPAPLQLDSSAAVRVGQMVLAIGNPFGLEQTLTVGVVSALGRIIQSPQDNRFIGEVIPTDAAINPGNSGGPLLDLAGRVIGVNSQIISPSGGSAGIGFAVPSDTVKRVVPELIAKGEYAHPWLGVRLFEITPSIADLMRQAGVKLSQDQGLVVLSVVDGGPADLANLQQNRRVARVGGVEVPFDGDIILAVDGQPVRSFQELTVYLESKTSVGDTATLTILRDGKQRQVPIVLGQQP